MVLIFFFEIALLTLWMFHMLNVPELLMYKNNLQEHTQKLDLSIPVYHTTNEGFHHATKFRSIVLFYGTTYASRLTFSHRKEAEPDVEKFALECIKEKLKVEDSSHYLQGM